MDLELKLITNANKIKIWWKKHNSITELKKIYNYLQSTLSVEELQELFNKCKAINNICNGDGAGLLGGGLVDMLLSRFFREKLKNKYQELHRGESDMRICEIDLSLKKINGKSVIALDWSKNKFDPKIKNKKIYFKSHIIIINLKTEKWWKIKPNHILNNKQNIIYNDDIKSGIYIIDKKYCKRYITLSSNNKTNTLINNQFLYIMLKRSISQNLCIEFPNTTTDIPEFNILNAFSF